MTSIEVSALAAVAALSKTFLTILIQGAARIRSRRFARPEDAQWLGGNPDDSDHPLAKTAQLVLRNDAESIPGFLFLLLGYALLGGDARTAAVHAVVFFLARSMHTLAYLCRTQPLRNVFFQFAMLSTLSLCGHLVCQLDLEPSTNANRMYWGRVE